MKSNKELQVFLRGGLGNQLYQYSTGVALALAQQRELVLRADLLPETEDSIGGVARWPNQIGDFLHSGKIQVKSHQPRGRTNLFGKSMQVMRLVGDKFPSLVANRGWLASENGGPAKLEVERPITLINSYSPYKTLAFSHRDLLHKEIRNIRNPSSRFLDLASEIKEFRPVVVHLRQGDYLNLDHIYGSSSLKFLKSALKELGQGCSQRNIWLFTDTPSSVPKEILSSLIPEKVIGPELLPRPLENLVLMSQAGGLIAANSSFSWWAAFLTSDFTPVVAPFISKARVNNFSIDSEPNDKWRILIADR